MKPGIDLKRGIPADSPSAPCEGDDAGDALDLRSDYISSKIHSYRAPAKRLFSNAKRKLQHDSHSAETAAREALAHAALAFWWAEGTDDEEQQHRLLHQIGQWTRQTFGCYLDYDGKRYHQRCPAAMAHIRAGYSIGIVGGLSCSICGDDLSECPHMRSRSYWVRGNRDETGRCRVCHNGECSHRVDHLYRAQVIGIVKSGHISEVSFVERPANPECHLRGMEIPPKSFAEKLGPGFRPGVPVSCDQCLNGCLGFTRPFDSGPQ